MKKYLILLLIPFLFGFQTTECDTDKCPGQSYELAAMNPYVAGTVKAATGPVIILNETFEGSTACYSGATGNDATCVVTWTRSNADATWYHALQAGAPADAGTYGVNLIPTDNAHRIYWDYGSSVARATYNVDIEFTLYINSATIDDDAYIGILSWASLNTGLSQAGALRVYNDTTPEPDQLSLVASGVSTSDAIDISAGTHYSVKIHLDTTYTDSYITVDATTKTFSRGTSNDGRYFIIGSFLGQGVGETLDFEIGHIKVTIYTD